MAASKKKPRKSQKNEPGDRQVRVKNSGESNRGKNPAWRIGNMDLSTEFPWSFAKIGREQWWEDIYPKLDSYESMTWQEILSATGGRSHGNNSHNIPISELIKEARDRLAEINLDDVDELFSLRLEGKIRIWGMLDNDALKILWYDPKHEICPQED
jgi:hypothetical protein